MGRGALGTRTGVEDSSAAVLTVLFTDIEGSTALIERLGDEPWVEVLSAHDAAVRWALSVHGGREVKTVGDGFLAVFTRAAPAVRAALEIQALVGALTVAGVPEGLRVRIGAHAGPVICKDGDVLGRNVNVARRIASAAAAGRVLVSSTVKVLADQDGGVRAGPAQTLRLKGIAEPQVVFDVTTAGPAAVHVLHERRPGLRLLSSSGST